MNKKEQEERHEEKPKYQQHTISVLDKQWKSIEEESRKQHLSKSKYFEKLIERQVKSGYVTIKSLSEWYNDRNDIRDWGTHQWICKDFLDSIYYYGSELHRQRMSLRSYTEKDIQKHIEESIKYHERIRKHIDSRAGFVSEEIYSKKAIENLSDPECIYDVNKDVKVAVLKGLRDYYKENRKLFLGFSECPTCLKFHVYDVNGQFWSYIWGDDKYLDTNDQSISEGLIEEFELSWTKRCKIKEKEEVLAFLDGIIEKIRNGK